MRIVLIGAGRLATNLGRALCKAGHEILCVYSRTLQSAQALAALTGGEAVNDIAHIPLQADVFVVAVKDSVLSDLLPRLTRGRDSQLFVHTAGSMPMSLWEGLTSHYGVFYPMQTFSKEREADFREISIFIEANNDDTLSLLQQLAASISPKVFPLTTEERKYLHLAAVFACNFVNHCYALSADILAQHGLPFDVMLPLVDETARKVHEMSPQQAQTGPAVRYDQNVMDMQAALLADHPLIEELYRKLSLSIYQKSANQ